MTTSMKAGLSVALWFIAAAATVSCGPGRPLGEIRGVAEGMRLSVTADSLPPRAGDDIHYRVTVVDAKTGQPIEGGQGDIWANSPDQTINPYDGFVPAPELGVYTAVMRFVVSGDWKMGMRFRRDSLSPFARMDWGQEVRAARPLGGG
jgi:hypothetical protein